MQIAQTLSKPLKRQLSSVINAGPTSHLLSAKSSSPSASTSCPLSPPSPFSPYLASPKRITHRSYSSTSKEYAAVNATDGPAKNAENTGDDKENDQNKDKDDKVEGGEAVVEGEDGSKKSDKKDLLYVDPDDYDDYYEPPRTAGEYVRFYASVFGQLMFIVLVTGFGFMTIRELLPSRLSPQTLFSECFDLLRNHDEVTRITGPDPTGYGRDVGHEARRNHVDSRQYTDDSDGSKRSRIRFNIKGRKGHVMVWAEVSDQMASNEFVYLIIQCRRTGRVVTIQDNRDRLASEAKAKKSNLPDSSAPGMDDALKKLLGYGKP